MEVEPMAGSGGRYSSGNWRVREGEQQEFIARWSEFVEWTKANLSGSNEVVLIQQVSDPQHFLSFGRWDGQDSIDAWRQSPEFAEKLGRCRELCDDFEANDYELAASFDK
jgi:heme-degrading monooxygenase HmoA